MTETSTPSQIGARAEFAVAAALVKTGWFVYAPFFNPQSRVDLVFEDDRGLFRVQCKTSNLKKDVVIFRTCSNTGNIPRSYQGEIDFFGVFSPELNQVFLVPIEHVASRICHLRIGATRNGQIKGTRYAADYLIGS